MTQDRHRKRCISGVEEMKPICLVSSAALSDVVKKYQNGEAELSDVFSIAEDVVLTLDTLAMVLDAFLPDDLVTFSRQQ